MVKKLLKFERKKYAAFVLNASPSAKVLILLNVFGWLQLQCYYKISSYIKGNILPVRKF